MPRVVRKHGVQPTIFTMGLASFLTGAVACYPSFLNENLDCEPSVDGWVIKNTSSYFAVLFVS